MRKRLLIVSPTPMRGGAEEYLLTLGTAAARNGWQVTACFEHASRTTTLVRDIQSVPGVTFLHMPVRGGRRWGVVGQAVATLAALARVRPSVVMVVAPWPTFALGNIVAAALLRVPAAVVFQLAPFPVELGRWGRPSRWARARRQRWIAVCRQNADALLASFGLQSGDVETIYNGGPRAADLDEAAHAGARARLRRELDLDPEVRVVLTVARLDAQKGHDDLLRAVEIATSAGGYDDVVFVWVGDGDLRSQLESAVTQRRLERRIKLVGHRDDVGAMLDGADLFVLPSHFEGLPFALIEALAHGVPSIASDAGGMPELLRDGIDGLIHLRRSPDDLAAKLSWALDHPGQMREMGVSGLTRSADFSTERMLSQTLALLHQLRSIEA